MSKINLEENSSIKVSSNTNIANMNYEYNGEILNYMLQKTMDINISYYFNTIQKNKINVLQRSKLVEWIIEVADELELYYITKQTSILILDLILSKVEISIGRLQLLAIASLMIVIKNQESFAFQLSDASALCAHAYTSNDVLDMELLILKQLKWQINYPCPGEIARRLIVLSQTVPMEYLKLVFKQIDNFIDICLYDFDSAFYGPLIIGIVSTILALEKSKMKAQAIHFIAFIHSLYIISLDHLGCCYDYVSNKIASLLNIEEENDHNNSIGTINGSFSKSYAQDVCALVYMNQGDNIIANIMQVNEQQQDQHNGNQIIPEEYSMIIEDIPYNNQNENNEDSTLLLSNSLKSSSNSNMANSLVTPSFNNGFDQSTEKIIQFPYGENDFNVKAKKLNIDEESREPKGIQGKNDKERSEGKEEEEEENEEVDLKIELENEYDDNDEDEDENDGNKNQNEQIQ